LPKKNKIPPPLFKGYGRPGCALKKIRAFPGSEKKKSEGGGGGGGGGGGRGGGGGGGLGCCKKLSIICCEKAEQARGR